MEQTELKPGFRRSRMSDIKGTRTRHIVTLNHNKASPGEDIYIEIPELKPDSCQVPGRLHFVFDFKNENAKSWFLNNLSKLLFDRFVIKLAGETVYDNTGESFLNVYRDMWLPISKRIQMIEYGLAGNYLRNLISKDDTAATSGDVSKVADSLMFSIHGTKQRIQLDMILKDHGLHAPFNINNNFRYIITLPKAADIMAAQCGQAMAWYTLENMELEYETIENQEIPDEIKSLYASERSSGVLAGGPRGSWPRQRRFFRRRQNLNGEPK